MREEPKDFLFAFRIFLDRFCGWRGWGLYLWTCILIWIPFFLKPKMELISSEPGPLTIAALVGLLAVFLLYGIILRLHGTWYLNQEDSKLRAAITTSLIIALSMGAAGTALIMHTKYTFVIDPTQWSMMGFVLSFVYGVSPFYLTSLLTFLTRNYLPGLPSKEFCDELNNLRKDLSNAKNKIFGTVEINESFLEKLCPSDQNFKSWSDGRQLIEDLENLHARTTDDIRKREQKEVLTHLEKVKVSLEKICRLPNRSKAFANCFKNDSPTTPEGHPKNEASITYLKKLDLGGV